MLWLCSNASSPKQPLGITALTKRGLITALKSTARVEE
jgi:hypothetical protein